VDQINPGGKQGDDRYDERMGYVKAPDKKKSFNAWLEEEWPEGKLPQNQSNMRFLVCDIQS